MKTIAAYTCKGTKNVGDLNSAPTLYFDYPGVEEYSCKMNADGPLPTEADLYIFGGGAITGRVTSCMSNGQCDGPKVAWGIGQSKKAGDKYYRSTLLSEFDRDKTFFTLIGTRDVNIIGTEWVPCASCMSPLFDKEYEIKHDVVVYMNTVKPPQGDNCFGNRNSFEETIAFLGSSAVVLTDSYHGAYWTTLLGRTAVIVNPYSSKFYQFKHQPIIVEDTRHLMQSPRVFPEALEECRAANIAFDAKVRDVMGL